MAPIPRLSAMVFESEYADVVREHAKIDRVRETRHQIAPYVILDNSALFRRCRNEHDRLVYGVQKLRSECRNLVLVDLSGLSQFGRCFRMLDYLHPIARRVVFIAS
jgi:hypothetical protein